MGLETYWQKRHFDRTAEPRGEPARRTGYSFVVQKHDARRLHYDFRLELDGVLLSWAIPKGPSLDPKVKRLAMQTEDHPLEYGGFEGVIPPGEYGGGTVLLWDRGTWEPHGDAAEMYKRGRINFALHGEKLQGSFHLVRTPGKGKGEERRWLFFKSGDEAARPGSDAQILEERPESVATGRDLDSIASDPDHVWTSNGAGSARPAEKAKPARQSVTSGEHETSSKLTLQHAAALAKRSGVKRAALPDFIEPELATLSAEAPSGADWLHEIKLDGYRIHARIEKGRAHLLSRRGHDWTTRLPSIASALGTLPIESGYLDGEVVVLGENGVSDFQRLQNSMEAGKDVACIYCVFDAPFLHGFDLRALPLAERKALLAEAMAQTKHERLRYSDHIAGEGAAFFKRACGLGLEGIISKRADAPYASGRSRAWLKVKCLSRQEFIIGGYTEPAGSRGHLGALLVGVQENGVLSYAGKVGTGFTQASLAELAKRLSPLQRSEPVFANPPRERRGVHWVEPRLVAEVAFMERTDDGLIRHASFQGLREDKAPSDVHLERPETGAPATARETTPSAKARAKAAKNRPVEKRAPRAGDTAPEKLPSKTSAAARPRGKASKASASKASPSAQAKPSKASAKGSPSAQTKPSKASASKGSPSAQTKPSKASASKGSPSAQAKTSKASASEPRPRAARKASSARAASAKRGAANKAKMTQVPIALDVSRLEVTHPDRILFPDPGITKRELMLHYARVARWMLPQVSGRPLMLVRCPEGAGKPCFHQKHPSKGMPRAVREVMVPQKDGPEANLLIEDVEGLLGLVQMGALEIHTWGCRAERLDCPDQLVFDLDPDEGLPWERVIEAAHTLRKRLDERGLTGFLRVTGGKGLHIVVPVTPTTPWDDAKSFTKAIADAMVRAEPTRYIATMTKLKRKGKIFLDYLRNGEGATAVCSYSTRARPGAPVCLPIDWDELDASLRPDAFNVRNLERRLNEHDDPWASFDDARAPIAAG
jgi:bifunctional non-homologous end joining protein LigD